MKLKNVFSKGRMNKDFDERLVPEGEYIDALNIRVVNTADGAAGVVVNEEGNTQLSSVNMGSDPVVVGSVTDESNEKIYWFVVNSKLDCRIYEYDVNTQIQRLIIQDTRSEGLNVLNFNFHYKVYGNVIFNISKKESLLLFTDGLNSPKLINIERASTYDVNGFEEDDISLYRKPPFKAPKITPFFSATLKENAIKEQFFAFAYRYKYLDGQYSALSSFSNYKFFPGLFELDYSTMENKGMVGIYNGYNIEYNTGDKRVTDIDICFKLSKENTVYVIDSINKNESDFGNNMTKTYQFLNKKIFKALPADELVRIFDDVPLTAKTQDFIKDRLIFGNTTSQYDLLENETDELPIKIDFHAELVSTDLTGESLSISVNTSGDSTEATITFTDVIFKADNEFLMLVDLESEEQTLPDNVTTYGEGSASFNAGIVLSQDYPTLQEFTASEDFQSFLDNLQSNFASQVNTDTHPDVVSSVYGSFELLETTSTTIKLKAPIITHTIDTTPEDSTDNLTRTEEEQFTWKNPQAFFSEESSNLSLKTNRSFEFGITYLDEFGRYTSVLLPKEDVTSGASEIFVPVSASEFLNRARITIRNKPPYWATRYKFFVKTNKEVYYNIFGTLFYEDGTYRWISMEGNNIGKVEPGSMMIVKSDTDGPIRELVKVKVLEIVNKTAQDASDAEEGWIDGNETPSGEPIKEKPGTYMKIKPDGFNLNFDPNNFMQYEGSHYRGFGSDGKLINHLPSFNFGSGITFGGVNIGGSSGLPPDGFLQNLNPSYSETSGSTDGYIDLILTPGSRIEFDWFYNEYDGEPIFRFKKKYTVQNTYESDDSVNAFDKWADAETSFTKDTSSGLYNEYTVKPNTTNREGEVFKWHIKKSGSTPPTNDRFVMTIEPSESIAWAEKGRMTCKLNIILIEGNLTFETDPEELNNEIYYETEQTFEIKDGFHEGNNQNQTSSQDAIVDLNFGNCFVFGNGIESISIRDDRFSPFLDVDTRPNISLLEGYRSLESVNKLIYSGSFNENSAYNSLNEFNSGRGITKFMDMKYGSVQRIHSREDDLLVFQEDRVSRVLFGKGVINAPDGTGSLTKIEQVLGQDVPFTGEYGIGKSPESFASYENAVYFADPIRGAALRLSQNGIEPISSQGMKSYFKTTLYNFRNHYNVGGYDPRHNQYVLTPGQAAKPPVIPITGCNTSFTKRVVKGGAAFNYIQELTEIAGTYTINYNIVSGGSINIDITYNGTTTTHSGLSGSGSVTFTGTPAQDPTAEIAVTCPDTEANQAFFSSTFQIENVCPQPETMKVTVLIVNDPIKANQTIVNRYKGSTNGAYNAVLDTFESDGESRFETYEGEMGSINIPQNGDTVTMSSFRIKAIHSADFNQCNDMGYWVTSAVNPTSADILTNANFSGNITQTENTTEEENTLAFTFNRNSTSENLYLVFDYRDQLPVLVDDSVTGISNGGTSVINVVANDSVPSPYTLEIITQPINGTATVVSGSPATSISYTHTAGNALTDTFQYRISRDGTCGAVATIATEALGITQDTYIYIYFDASGSMNNTLTELQAMRTNSLKSVLQDLYATGNKESDGNTDSSTNGSDAYDDHVTIVYSDVSGSWNSERTWAALSDNDVNDFVANGHNDFPSDATNVVILVFQDEAQGSQGANYHDSAYDGDIQGNHASDIASLRSRINTLNSSNNNFYRGVLFQVDGSAAFKSYVEAVENGTGNFSGTNGLSDLASGATNYLGFTYDIEDSNNNDASAPYKPGTTDRFDKWEYYYLYHVTNELKNLGFDDNGSLGWPKILDDD